MATQSVSLSFYLAVQLAWPPNWRGPAVGMGAMDGHLGVVLARNAEVNDDPRGALAPRLTAFPFSHGMLPYVAKDIYGTDANGLAQLMAAYAVGALAGSIGLAWSGRTAQATRIVIAGIYAWYLLLLVFAFSGSKTMGIAVLVGVGLVQSLSMISMAIALLMITSIELRGRVMGLRMLAVYGLPLGLLAGGALIERIGFTAQAMLYALSGLALTTLITLRWREVLWRRGPGA